MDDEDFVFINKTLSEKEDKEFSVFLQKRKAKNLRNNAKKETSILKKQ